MRRVCEILFILAWLLCGCSVESFFDGGALLFCLSILVVIGTAMIICSD